MYVPEVHPVTGFEFCEREDEGHVFKVKINYYYDTYKLKIFNAAYWTKSQVWRNSGCTA